MQSCIRRAMHPRRRRCSSLNTPGFRGRRALPAGRLADLPHNNDQLGRTCPGTGSPVVRPQTISLFLLFLLTRFGAARPHDLGSLREPVAIGRRGVLCRNRPPVRRAARTASRSRASSAREGPKKCMVERDMDSDVLAFTSLSDDQLLTETKRLVACERTATAALLRSLMEVDSRRLYLREGCSSLFTYCTQVLHLAEGAAYNRIEAARAARRFPSVLTALEDGSLTLASARLLAPHFTPENHGQLIEAARHKASGMWSCWWRRWRRSAPWRRFCDVCRKNRNRRSPAPCRWRPCRLRRVTARLPTACQEVAPSDRARVVMGRHVTAP